MPFTQMLILVIPPVFLGVIIVAITVFLSMGGLLITRCFISHQKLKVHNDVAGPIFGTMGVIYAVLLAFIVVVTWENFDKANLNVEKEANCVADLYFDSGSFPESVQKEIRFLLKEYTEKVTGVEWQAIGRGESSGLVDEVLNKIRRVYTGYNPTTMNEESFFKESVRKLNELIELRRMRIVDARTGVHQILWFVLIGGAVITIIFSFFFGTENFGAQLIMTTLLAALIGLILFTILELDFPFTGRVSIMPDAFRDIFRFL